MVAEQLPGDRPPERGQVGGQLPAALVGARLAGQVRKQMAQPPAGEVEEPAVARALEQHLRRHQAEQLAVGDLLRPPTPRPRMGRKEGAGGALECDEQ